MNSFCTGGRIWSHPSSSVGSEDDPTLRNAESQTRDHGSRSEWSWKKHLHQNSGKGTDALWNAAQRDEDESKSHHFFADVRSVGCFHQRLDRRNLFHSLEKNSEDEEGGVLFRELILLINII